MTSVNDPVVGQLPKSLGVIPARGGSQGLRNKHLLPLLGQPVIRYTLEHARAAQLLTLVIEADQPRALSDLAGDAALPKSTASRLLSALERQGLVEQHGRRGSFEPGPVLRRFANRGQLVELAQAHLERLSAISGETINLAVPGPLGVEHLAQIESRHFLAQFQRQVLTHLVKEAIDKRDFR